jgi:serine/threonine-protein kinase
VSGPEAASAREPRVGDWIEGRYQLVRCIGKGGMGMVFEARHSLLDSAYALKFLREEFAVQPQLSERFLREARIAGRIDNPHVVKVFDVNTTASGLPYMVMDLLQGETLHERCRRRDRDPLDEVEIHTIMTQVLTGVAAAHRLGVVHRDLKPANVMLARDDEGKLVVKVLDFGLAKLLEAGASGGLTDPGTVLGTADYMPPEQAFGQHVDQRADVFALGVIFFELLAGRRPVEAEGRAEIASAYLMGRARRLQDCVPSVAPELAAVIHQAIQPEAADRFDSAISFREAFAKLPAPAPARRAPQHERTPDSVDGEPRAGEKGPTSTQPDTSVVPWPQAGWNDLADEPRARATAYIVIAIVIAAALAALAVWVRWW